jgi:hypothetical protein
LAIGRIVGQPFQWRQVTDGGHIRHLGRGRGLAAHDLLDDLIFVDGVGNGLAHADIGKGVPGLLLMSM